MGRLSFPYGSKLYFDTAPIIYSVEKHPIYWPTLESVWAISDAEEFQLSTSELTLLETLVQPLKHGKSALVTAYEEFSSGDTISLVPISAEILRTAAELRAHHNLKTPDAIHAATAIISGCEYLVANDTGFRRLTNINVIILDDLI